MSGRDGSPRRPSVPGPASRPEPLDIASRNESHFMRGSSGSSKPNLALTSDVPGDCHPRVSPGVSLLSVPANGVAGSDSLSGRQLDCQKRTPSVQTGSDGSNGAPSYSRRPRRLSLQITEHDGLAIPDRQVRTAWRSADTLGAGQVAERVGVGGRQLFEVVVLVAVANRLEQAVALRAATWYRAIPHSQAATDARAAS